jgi:protein TonB
VGGREKDAVLKLYEQETEVVLGPGERLFRIAALASFLLFGAIGLYLKTHNPPPQVMEEKADRARQVSFVMEEKKKPVAPAPVKKVEPVVKKEPKKEEPIDLTKNPVLAQKIDDVKPPPKPEAEPVRRVYGLRKVYSTGIGAGGDAGDAVIGKQGNTLNADIDTLTATQKDLKGQPVPITTVTSAPKVKTTVKPEYSEDMVEAKVEGLVKAELLIDTAGHVVEVKVLNDLGHGTREKAREAFLKWVFEPAKRGNEPVSVWITYAIRFVLIDE